jgi:dipeptidyl aminopeptidase/acylaminoacyl peptidase
LQGSEDKVVPPNQAEAIIKKIRARDGHVEYVLFEGEGHGWRKAENVKRALETECRFYEQILGLN